MTKAIAALMLVSGLAMAQEAAPPPAAESQMRFRIGISGGGGVFIPGTIVTFQTPSFRIGMQINELLGVYADTGLTWGFGFGASSTSTSASVSVAAVGYWHAGLAGELTFGDMFFVAAGPMIAGGGWTSLGEYVDASGNAQIGAVAAGGYMPGAIVRLGVGFGAPKATGRRNQFTIAIDTKIMFTTVTSASVGTGGTAVKTGDSIVGIAPLLMLGWDFK